MRSVLVVIAAASACSSDPACPYDSSGAVTFRVARADYTGTCFQSLATTCTGSCAPAALVSAGTLSPGSKGISMQVELYSTDVFTGAPCMWESGASAALASGCFAMGASGLVDDGVDRTVWSTAAGKYASSFPDAPSPTGSLTVDAWATGAGQVLSITFSSDAAMTYPASYQQNGPASALVPVSGSVSTVTRQIAH